MNKNDVYKEKQYGERNAKRCAKDNREPAKVGIVGNNRKRDVSKKYWRDGLTVKPKVREVDF